MAQSGVLSIDGHQVKVSNLDKVLYPDDGSTKHDVIGYYLSVGSTMLPHVAGRPATRKRWPDGVGSKPFFEKNVPRGTPSWIRTVVVDSPGSTRDREQVTYPLLASLADLAWLANLAALELHVPQWTVGPRGGIRQPNRLVIDLDPGAPAGLAECAVVARHVRDRLVDDGLEPLPVTSGSKGLQLYAAISGDQDGEVVRSYARRLAESLENDVPDLVVSSMSKQLRPGKVLLDWSQNNPAKTTIAPYSLRGRERATVATPRGWDELDGDLTQVHRSDVAQRLDQYGDLAARLLESGPRLPTG